jgi:DNA helicase-2/ATP-dependent DNA helicase PcrA
VRAGLSPEQLACLDRKTPSASILAAAGSGKTRTLVHLVGADLRAGMAPEAIVAFTFTERAAEELLARIHALVRKSMPDIDLSKMYIGTIHAWCLNYLLNQSDFYGVTALDELQLEAVVSRLYDHLELEKAYKKSYPYGIEPFLADVEVFYNEHIELEAVPLQIRGSIARFLETLTSSRLMTFGGMIRNATEHLQRNGPLAQLRAVYVDEYQDVNPAQVALVKAMAPPSAKILGVGDDLQCIYQWRGSDVTRILQFTTEFPGSDVHRLPTNHRSQPSIVSLANAVAKDVLLRDPEKKMLPGRGGDLEEAVFWLSTDSELAQAQKVTEIVKRFMAEGVPPNAIAVLLRSVNSAGGPIVDTLKDAGIPVACPTLNRGRQFVDAVLMPVFDWIRKEQLPPKNEVEEKDLEVATARLWDSVRPWVAPGVDENTFWGALNEWLDLIDEKKAKAYDVRGRLYEFLNALGIVLRCSDHELLLGLGIASQIIRSVEEIHRRRFPSQPRRTPRGIISEVYHALLRRQHDFGESSPVEELADGVTVCTVHQAKGLEWPIVILPMLKARRFPLSPSPHGTSFPDKVAVRYGTSTDDERRLFYVATTRAKERLFLLDPCSSEPKKRSRFLDDLVAARRLTGPVELDSLPETVWTLPPKALEKPDPAPLRIGLSELLLYLECPFQFALRRVVGVQPAVGDELGYGKSLHELIQRRLESGPWSDAELEAQAKKHVFLPLMSQSGEDSSRAAIIRRLRELERLGLFTAGTETELEIEAVVEGGIVSGIIDVAQVNTDGSLLIRDWKASVHPEFLHRYQRQLGFYAYALRKQGRVVAGADIVDVAQSAEQKRIITHAVEVSEGSIGSTLTQLETGLKGIGLGQYPATPSPSVCAVCDMRNLCGERADDAVGHE